MQVLRGRKSSSCCMKQKAPENRKNEVKLRPPLCRPLSKVPEGHHPRGTTLREALRGNLPLRGLCRGLSEGSAGSLRGFCGVSAGLCGGPRDFPRVFGGSDPMLVTLGNCWTPEALYDGHRERNRGFSNGVAELYFNIKKKPSLPKPFPNPSPAPFPTLPQPLGVRKS